MPTRISLIVAVTIGLLLSTSSQADIINVPADQPTIQAGIDAASGSDEVVVAPGTYNEVINFNGKAITLRSSDGADATTIDGTGLNDSVVKCVSGEGLDTVLDGFTISGGTGDHPWGPENSTAGGGMFNGNASSPTVIDCRFMGNSATLGGAVYNRENSGPTLTNCSFITNSADDGGAVFNQDSSPQIINCNFETNESGQSGGGAIKSEGASIVLKNCRFVGNFNLGGGGAIFDAIGDPTIVNCIFSNNSAVSGGAAFFTSSNPTFTNCTFFGNSAETSGGVSTQNGNLVVRNSIFWGNSDNSGSGADAQINVLSGQASVFYSCIQDEDPNDDNIPFGGTNIDDDPMLVDPDNGDLHISLDSPCTDVGNNAFVEDGAVDMDGEERIQNEIVDMGADEFTFCPADINGDGIVNAADLAQLLGAWGPCPEPPADCPADIHGDGDGIVQADDLATLLGSWGSCEP